MPDQPKRISKVAVMGAGAVGSYFGCMLARAGADVTLIARGAHLEAMQRNHGLFLDSVNFHELVPVHATADPAAVAGVDLVLFSVKTTGTAEAAKAIAPHIAPDTIVLSLQNGVDNVAEIRAASGIEALASVVYVAAALPEPGRMRHGGRGDLVLDDSPRSRTVAAAFVPAGVPCRLSNNLEGDIWQKFILNCSSNAVTALGRVGYGAAASNPYARRLIADAQAEGEAIARAAGIRLPEASAPQGAQGVLANYDPSVTSSTAQDVAQHRKTEIDHLNGYMARRAEELGVPAPINRTLYALVKLLEDSY